MRFLHLFDKIPVESLLVPSVAKSRSFQLFGERPTRKKNDGAKLDMTKVAMYKLMRMMTIPCVSFEEMRDHLYRNAPLLHSVFVGHGGSFPMLDFMYIVIEKNGLSGGMVPTEKQRVIAEIVKNMWNSGVFDQLENADLGKIWFGSLTDTYFHNTEQGRLLDKLCREKLDGVLNKN